MDATPDTIMNAEIQEFIRTIPQCERNDFFEEFSNELMEAEMQGSHRRRIYTMVGATGMKLADIEEEEWGAQKADRLKEFRLLVQRVAGVSWN